MAIKIKIPKSGGEGSKGIRGLPRDPVLRAALVAVLLLAVSFTIVFSYFYIKYDRIIEKRFRTPVFANSAKIYALPRVLREGEKIDAKQIAAELRRAEAEIQLGRGSAWPDVALGFRYGRDEGSTIARGGLTFTLPVFSRGQELRATGESRATRLRRELEAGRLAVVNEVKTAFEIQKRRAEAAAELRQNGVQVLDENEVLALRSFEEGEMNLLDLLLIRRDAFETRLLYLGQLLETRLAAADLEARAGVLK